MSPRHLLTLVMSMLLLAACAATEQNIRETRCHYDGAYELGMNDARAGWKMDSGSFVSLCDPAQRAVIQGGYRDGYQAGLASRAADAKAAAHAAPHHADGGQPTSRVP